VGEFADLYARSLRNRGWHADAAQRAAVNEFEALESRLLAAGNGGILGRLLGRQSAAAEGLYLWGGVGRGKTFLLDLFAARAVVPTVRYHFHHFMQEVHAELSRLHDEQDPLVAVARQFAGRCRVLCFDELAVSDIADAMILAGLFSALIAAGVTLVITSNTPPSGLYPDGLQRARFLPAIALLEACTRVLELDAGTDYRLRELIREPIWVVGAGTEPDRQLAERFAALAGESATGPATVTVAGREIPTRGQAAAAVWFDFSALCDGPRGVPDYIAIGERFALVAVSSIPLFDGTNDDPARRFIAVIDEFYERRVKLLASAAAAPDQLYAGTRLAFAFRRTASRLVEMQSRDYLAQPHRTGGDWTLSI
jgi:cell division protein ZapE